MIGHIEIIQARKQGLKPSIVFVFDYGEIRSDSWFSPEDMLQNGFIPEVHIHLDDDIAKLDFRFLVGCAVAINTNNRDRSRLLYRAIKKVVPQSLTVSDGTFTHHEERHATTTG